MKQALFSFICFSSLFVSECLAQYYGQRSLEQSFEQNDLFFQPSFINPYGIGTFTRATPGLIDDPFLNLQINPAWFNSDSSFTNHLYLDFRNYRQTATLYQPYIYTMYSNSVAIYAPHIVYPYYLVNSRPIIEPIISAAFLTEPASSTLPGLHLGITYQGIMQDTKYYTIPFDIYQSNLGYDYMGNSIASSSAIPITTVSSGEDEMNHTGSLFSVYAGYEIDPDLKLGVRVGRVLFDGNGSYGNQNYWGNYYYGSGTSLYYNMESREQSYNHWDMSGGIQYGLNSETTIGVTGGYLWGRATQSLMDRDTSYYNYGTDNLSTSSGKTTEYWNHSGKTYYGGLNIISRLNDQQTLTFVYQYDGEDVDIGLNSNVIDTSYYTYSYSYDTNYSYSMSNSAFLSKSGGGGKLKQFANRILLSMSWKFGDNSELTIGGVVSVLNRKTNTAEPTTVDGHSYSVYTSNTYDHLYYDTTNQVKDVNWSFVANKWALDIPVIFTHRFSDKVSLLLGLDRQMSEWKMTDKTLVIYYSDVGNSSAGGPRNKSNYGELYAAPDQNISDVSTTFLAGLTVSPVNKFNVRLLLSPSIRSAISSISINNFQWWIGFNLYP